MDRSHDSGRLPRRILAIPSIALAIVSTAFPAATSTSPVTMIMWPFQGSAAQGFPFRFEALARNNTGDEFNAWAMFELVPPGLGEPVTFAMWAMTIPPLERITTTVEVTASQWFADLGTFEIRALVKRRPVGDPLQFDVSAPTVAVPVFEDVTAALGLQTTLAQSQCGEYAAGAAWGDIEGDGDLDLFVPLRHQAAQLWVNDGAGHFADQAQLRGADNGGSEGVGAVFSDYDNDGDPDLYVVNDGVNKLYQNDGDGGFADVAPASGVDDPGSDASASWSDYDNDGNLDLYVTSNSPCAPPVMYEQDRLYHNEGDGTFTDQTDLLPVGSTMGAGFQAAWFDYDRDGDQDLYLANDWWGPDRDQNHLWRNDGAALDGTWRFTDVSLASGAGYQINSMGIGLSDFDRDLDLDMAISNVGGNVLARNNGDGTFTDVAAQTRVARPLQWVGHRAVTWGIGFADLNLDGWEDMYAAAGGIADSSEQPSEVFTNDGVDGRFLDLSSLSGANDTRSSRGVAFADYDRDGLIDLYVVNKAGSPILYHNVTSAPGFHWLEVRLAGVTSNRDACGARLTLTVGGARLLREVFCGSTSLSSGSDPAVHFGLGSDPLASSLVIAWPSGIRQVVRNLAGDQLIEITEPASP
jgi:hypothetical protein